MFCLLYEEGFGSFFLVNEDMIFLRYFQTDSIMVVFDVMCRYIYKFMARRNMIISEMTNNILPFLNMDKQISRIIRGNNITVINSELIKKNMYVFEAPRKLYCFMLFSYSLHNSSVNIKVTVTSATSIMTIVISLKILKNPKTF